LPMAEAIAEAGFAVHAWARRAEVFGDPQLATFAWRASPQWICWDEAPRPSVVRRCRRSSL
jgi:hypothetical protein